MEFKRGQVFYGCWPYTDDTGRVEITVDEWVVRSVQKKRNSQQRWGVPKFTPDNTVYVNLTQRVVDLTIHRKTGAWMKSIPACCRRQFIAANGLPGYLFTTPLQALKYALKVADTDAERRAVKSRITKLRNKRARA